MLTRFAWRVRFVRDVLDRCLSPVPLGMGGAVMDVSRTKFNGVMEDEEVPREHWKWIWEDAQLMLAEHNELGHNPNSVVFTDEHMAELMKLTDPS